MKTETENFERSILERCKGFVHFRNGQTFAITSRFQVHESDLERGYCLINAHKKWLLPLYILCNNPPFTRQDKLSSLEKKRQEAVIQGHRNRTVKRLSMPPRGVMFFFYLHETMYAWAILPWKHARNIYAWGESRSAPKQTMMKHQSSCSLCFIST